MVRPSGKAQGREQIVTADDTFHKRYDSYVPDDMNEEVMEGRDDAPARHQISGAASVYSLQSCPARAEAALISSKRSKAASSVTSRQSRAATIKVDNRACNSGIQQNWHESDDGSSSAAASHHQDVTHILSGLSSLTSDCSSAVASAKSPESIRSVFSKRSHSSVLSGAASVSSRKSYSTTKSTPSVSSRKSTSSSAVASRQHDATSIMSGSASPTFDCTSEVASAKSYKSTRSASSKKSHSLPSAASVSSRRSYSTAKSTPSSRQSRAVVAGEDNRACSSGLKQDWHELGDSPSAAASRKQAEETCIITGLSSLTSDCSLEEASTSAKSRKSMRSVFSKGSRSRKSKSSKKSSNKSKLEVKVTPTIIAEEGENDDDIVDTFTHRSSNHSGKKEPSSTSRNQAKKQIDLEFWSALAVRVAMAVMRAKGTEKMAQRASNMVHQEGQRHAGREHSREMMSLLSAKLSMAILEAGGDGSLASAVMIAVMMAGENKEDVISMLSDDKSTDPSIAPSVASTASDTPSDDSTPSIASNIQLEWLKSTGQGSITQSKAKSKPKKTSQANQSPSVSVSLSVGSSTSTLKRRQLESIQKEMEEKKRQLESLEMDIENAKKRAAEEAERLLKTEMDSSIQPDKSKLDYILKEREQKRQQLQITRNELEAKKRAAKEAMRLEYMLMEFEKRKKAFEEEELRNCLKRAENVLHQELAKINSDLGKVGEREVEKANTFMEPIWNTCGILCSGDPGDPCSTIQSEGSLYTDDWTIPSPNMSFEHSYHL